MALYLVTSIFCITIASYALPVTDENSAELYLKKFGYLEESPENGSLAMTAQRTVSIAIKEFQKFAGLSETGELNNETIVMINTPRCGMKDKIRHSTTEKQYVLEGSKWPLKTLTYRISKYPSRFTDKRKIQNEIAQAFKMWSDVTTLNFKKSLRGAVDIDIRFEIGHHGDGHPFDGPEGVLAHAFTPEDSGDVHFDDEEIWTINKKFGINVLQVATHEFGHSLGLSHSNEKNSSMFPYYPGYIPGFQLHFDDIKGIQAIYGLHATSATPDDENFEAVEPTPDTRGAPNLCQDSKIDTITRTKSGRTYVFKGDFYWVLSDSIAKEYPKNISDDWDGLEGDLDASVTWWSIGKTYFFKGKRYWRFTNKKMDPGYPQLMSKGFKGIPDNLDAAFVWSSDGKTYFFKGDQYWLYDIKSKPHVSSRYPQPVEEWSDLLADGIDAAFQWEKRRTYFFKGDQYYRYNDKTSEVDEVDPPYPRSTATGWFGCT